MVERHPDRGINHDPPGPGRVGPMAHFGKRAGDVAGAREDDAAEPAREGAAIIFHPTVIGAVHRHFEQHVVARGPGAEPARGQRQIDLDPFQIHVGDARGGVGIYERRRLALAGDPGKPGHIAARSFV